MDKVKETSTGELLTVNSAHYLVSIVTGEQGISVIGRPDEVFPASNFDLVHRCEFKPYKNIKRCECGEIYTTMADTIKPRYEIEH